MSYFDALLFQSRNADCDIRKSTRVDSLAMNHCLRDLLHLAVAALHAGQVVLHDRSPRLPKYLRRAFSTPAYTCSSVISLRLA